MKNIFRWIPAIPAIALLTQLPYLWRAWHGSRIDWWDMGYWIVAAILLIPAFAVGRGRMAQGQQRTPDWVAWAPGVFALAILAYGMVATIQLAWLVGVILLLIATIWWCWGWGWLWRLAPLGVLLLLGLPSTGYLVLLPWSVVQWKWCVGLGAVLWFGLALWWHPRRPGWGWVIAVGWSLALLGIAGIAEGNFLEGAGFMPNFNRTRSGNFLGTQVEISDADRRFFSGCSASARYDFFAPAGMISVLALSSGESIHNVHSPGVCLTASGWNLVTDSVILVKIDDRSVAVNRLEVERVGGGRALFFCWYSQQDRSVGDFLLFRSLWRPGSVWHIYQLSTMIEETPEAAEARLLEFLQTVNSDMKAQSR